MLHWWQHTWRVVLPRYFLPYSNPGVLYIAVRYCPTIHTLCLAASSCQKSKVLGLGNIAGYSVKATWLHSNIAAMHCYLCVTVPGCFTAAQAVWGLGNIAGDSPVARSTVLAAGALPPLLQLLQKPPATIDALRNAVWLLCNLCAGKRPSSEDAQVRWQTAQQRGCISCQRYAETGHGTSPAAAAPGTGSCFDDSALGAEQKCCSLQSIEHGGSMAHLHVWGECSRLSGGEQSLHRVCHTSQTPACCVASSIPGQRQQYNKIKMAETATFTH
jgi:hypothetical protein